MLGQQSADHIASYNAANLASKPLKDPCCASCELPGSTGLPLHVQVSFGNIFSLSEAQDRSSGGNYSPNKRAVSTQAVE